MYINAGAFAIGCTKRWALKDAERPYSKLYVGIRPFAFQSFVYIWNRQQTFLFWDVPFSSLQLRQQVQRV